MLLRDCRQHAHAQKQRALGSLRAAQLTEVHRARLERPELAHKVGHRRERGRGDVQRAGVVVGLACACMGRGGGGEWRGGSARGGMAQQRQGKASLMPGTVQACMPWPHAPHTRPPALGVAPLRRQPWPPAAAAPADADAVVACADAGGLEFFEQQAARLPGGRQQGRRRLLLLLARLLLLPWLLLWLLRRGRPARRRRHALKRQRPRWRHRRRRRRRRARRRCERALRCVHVRRPGSSCMRRPLLLLRRKRRRRRRLARPLRLVG